MKQALLLFLFVFLLTWGPHSVFSAEAASGIIFFLGFKLLGKMNHFLVLLITIEAILMLSFFYMNMFAVNNSMAPAMAFLLMVLMVMGACLGLSMMVVVSRSFSKGLEMTKLKL